MASTDGGSPPLEPGARIKSLCQQASAVDIDHNIPPKRYFRSGIEMDRMARIYLDEDNLENAFILYTKFITLFVEKLPKHALYNQATPKEKADTRKKMEKIFPIAEILKTKLKDRYAIEYKQWKEQEEERVKQEAERRAKLQQEEAERKRLESERKQNELSKQQAQVPVPVIPPAQPETDARIGEYPGPPSIPAAIPASIPAAAGIEPVAPTAPAFIGTAGTPSSANTPENQAPTSVRTTEIAPPTYDRAVKPDTLLSRQDSSLVNGLRRVFVPHVLIAKFIGMAAENTKKNLETCGILTGKLAKHVFHVTHLIIPKQTATPDSCDTLNEEELFDLQDSFDLITLGWIHTHPTQTSFLSSVDLHTQYSYQQLMPEAIAIVCAPKYDQLGVYQLTPAHGLGFIGRCRKPGFHPHPKEPPLFQECEHVIIDEDMELEVLDLR